MRSLWRFIPENEALWKNKKRFTPESPARKVREVLDQWIKILAGE